MYSILYILHSRMDIRGLKEQFDARKLKEEMDARNLKEQLSVCNCYDPNTGTIKVNKIPSDILNLLKRTETLEQENKALRTHIDYIESRVAIWQKEYKEAIQLELRDMKESLKHEVLEDVNERIATLEKKEPGLWDRVRGYFVNKKVRMELGKQLL